MKTVVRKQDVENTITLHCGYLHTRLSKENWTPALASEFPEKLDFGRAPLFFKKNQVDLMVESLHQSMLNQFHSFRTALKNQTLQEYHGHYTGKIELNGKSLQFNSKKAGYITNFLLKESFYAHQREKDRMLEEHVAQFLGNQNKAMNPALFLMVSQMVTNHMAPAWNEMLTYGKKQLKKNAKSLNNNPVKALSEHPQVNTAKKSPFKPGSPF